MPEEAQKNLASWKIPEHVRHERGRLWYFLVFLIGGATIVYSVFTNNFLFALILVIFAIVYGLLHTREPDLIEFSITERGIKLGNAETEYKNIDSFWLVIKPEEKIKNLYIRLNSFLNPFLSIPLEDKKPEEIRELLVKHIKEDQSIKDEPGIEILSRSFKL